MNIAAKDFAEERVLRLARKQERRLGTLYPAAFDELLLSVRKDPDAFEADDEERAFAVVSDAVARLESAFTNDEFLSDDEYRAARAERFSALRDACDEAVEIYPRCADARLLRLLACDVDATERVDQLVSVDATLDAYWYPLNKDLKDQWTDVFAHPSLRVKAALARHALSAADHRMALGVSQSMLDLAPTDTLGLRFTAALALARLEDEKGFDELDARFDRHGNAWSNLARPLLFFKLDRMPAARRALNGYLRLNEGAAYALLRPSYVEAYLPYRPPFEPGSYQEAVLAVHEADGVVVDVPDFIDWCSNQPGVIEDAAAFAQANGFDW